MKYYTSNGMHIVEVPVADFAIEMCNKKKKTASDKDYCNAGFFASYKEGSEEFTLPAGHVVCDYKASGADIKRYCTERGKFLNNTKFQFDSGKWSYSNNFFGHKLSTLMVSKGSATIMDVSILPDGLDYAIAGVPIMRNGADVKFAAYVRDQGWDSSTLYGTWHTFLGLKEDGKTIYVIGLRTYTANMISSAEAFKKFKKLGLRDVIKLDGGGSFHMNVGGKSVASTLENRLINTIITFGGSSQKKEKNPFPIPTRVLRKGCTGQDVKWLQFQLNADSVSCDMDGSFGPATLSAVQSFQRKHGLQVDGSVGPATKNALLKI